MRRRHDPETGEPWRTERRGNEPRLLSELLRATARDRHGWGRRLDGARVHGAWEDIAGPQLARSTEPVRLVGGVLVVRATSAAWATQLRYLAGELLQRANTVLGPGTVERVRVVTGPLQGTGYEPEKGP